MTPNNYLSEKSILQDSINNLVDWDERWQLKFNSKKCRILHIGKTIQNMSTEYSISECGGVKTLSESNSEKD